MKCYSRLRDKDVTFIWKHQVPLHAEVVSKVHLKNGKNLRCSKGNSGFPRRGNKICKSHIWEECWADMTKGRDGIATLLMDHSTCLGSCGSLDGQLGRVGFKEISLLVCLQGTNGTMSIWKGICRRESKRGRLRLDYARSSNLSVIPHAQFLPFGNILPFALCQVSLRGAMRD